MAGTAVLQPFVSGRASSMVSQIMDVATVHPRPHVLLLLLQQAVPKEQKSELGGACLYRQHLGGGGRKT